MDNTCSICLQTLTSNQLKTVCQHEFHYPCLIEYYLKINKTSLIDIEPPTSQNYMERKLCCPLCRTTLDIYSIFDYFLKRKSLKGNSKQLFQTFLSYKEVSKGINYIFIQLNKTNWFPLFYQLVKLKTEGNNPNMKIYTLMLTNFIAGFVLNNVPYSVGVEYNKKIIILEINKDLDSNFKELDLLLNRIGQSIVTKGEKIVFGYMDGIMKLRYPKHERSYVTMDVNRQIIDKDAIPQSCVASFLFNLDFHWNNLNLPVAHINSSDVIIIHGILTSMILV